MARKFSRKNSWIKLRLLFRLVRKLPAQILDPGVVVEVANPLPLVRPAKSKQLLHRIRAAFRSRSRISQSDQARDPDAQFRMGEAGLEKLHAGRRAHIF